MRLLSADELEEILDSSSEYVSIVSVLDILSTSIDIKSFVSCDGSQLVAVAAHKEKIQLLLIAVLIILAVGFLLYPPFC